jgi:diaminopropionate ammonia-lyase
LGAFKVLGASWAVARALSERAGRPLTTLDALRECADRSPVRLVTATDGNHGRAVAYVARLLGLPAQVFVPSDATEAVVGRIVAEGAAVVRSPGNYDATVEQARRAAEEAGSLLVQDTAWPGYVQVPAWIVEGYATLLIEVDHQIRDADAQPAGLVAVPVGVGSLAQAVVAHYRSAGSGTAVLGVEPDAAPCFAASLTAGHRLTVETGHTAMAGLNCGTPSSLAWPVLREGMDAAVVVDDVAAGRAGADLAAAGVPSGPSGAASLAGVRAALAGPPAAERRQALDVGGDTVVVLLNTEGRLA